MVIRSLFLKIFLWFWATAILTGMALVLMFILEPQSVPSQWRTMLIETARYMGTSVVAKADVGGGEEASALHFIGVIPETDLPIVARMADTVCQK